LLSRSRSRPDIGEKARHCTLRQSSFWRRSDPLPFGIHHPAVRARQLSGEPLSGAAQQAALAQACLSVERAVGHAAGRALLAAREEEVRRSRCGPNPNVCRIASSSQLHQTQLSWLANAGSEPGSVRCTPSR
jgi:hypothetical protein